MYTSATCDIDRSFFSVVLTHTLDSSDLAQNVLDAGTVPLLVLCIQEPEITLKRISASAMSDVCKHTPELAQAVVDAGAVAYLSPLIMHPDSKLKRQVRLLLHGGDRVYLCVCVC